MNPGRPPEITQNPCALQTRFQKSGLQRMFEYVDLLWVTGRSKFTLLAYILEIDIVQKGMSRSAWIHRTIVKFVPLFLWLVFFTDRGTLQWRKLQFNELYIHQIHSKISASFLLKSAPGKLYCSESSARKYLLGNCSACQLLKCFTGAVINVAVTFVWVCWCFVFLLFFFFIFLLIKLTIP